MDLSSSSPNLLDVSYFVTLFSIFVAIISI